MLEPAPTWQVSHAVVIGMWLLGGPTIAKFAAGIANPATTLAAWHCAQFVVVLGALAWISARLGITEKSFDLWHEVQSEVTAVGM